MASGKDVVCSPSLTTSTGTLASPSSLHAPQPTFPFDLLPEILCRLPVKILLQFKCVCKSWKSLISDPKFVKKHLRVSKTYHHHHHVIVKGRDNHLWDSTVSSIFSDASTISSVPQLQLTPPEAIKKRSTPSCISSCDGILLFTIGKRPPLLWNPSIRKSKSLPPLLNPGPRDYAPSTEYTFGYDHFIDNYKVFAITFLTSNIRVDVYTLGANSWRRIDNFPYTGSISGPGMFVGGCVNWLAHAAQLSNSRVIVSLDLEEESYRRLLMPDFKEVYPTLGVLRDCLSIIVNNTEFFDVWVMKEYGIEESWTKLFSVPVRGPFPYVYTKVLYVLEDDQVLLDFKETPQLDLKLVVYNSTNGTFKIPRIQKISDLMYPEVYVESLISPFS